TATMPSMSETDRSITTISRGVSRRRRARTDSPVGALIAEQPNCSQSTAATIAPEGVPPTTATCGRRPSVVVRPLAAIPTIDSERAIFLLAIRLPVLQVSPGLLNERLSHRRCFLPTLPLPMDQIAAIVVPVFGLIGLGFVAVWSGFLKPVTGDALSD